MIQGISALLKPIRPDEVEWRVQFSKTFKDKVIVVPYITNRCVMDRFDTAFGWDGWSSTIREINNGFICQIKVGSVIKEDGASKSDIEPEKGGISDSMKRCAVQFGLGRDLYKYPRVFIENNDQKIPSWAYARLSDLVQYINDNGSYPQPFVVIKNTGK